VDRLLPWRAVASAEAAEDDVTNNTVKKVKKSWSSVQIFDMPLQTTGKRVSRFFWRFRYKRRFTLKLHPDHNNP
jgi:hypothetical protein